MKTVLIVVPGFVNFSREPIQLLEQNGFTVIEKDYGLAGLNENEAEFCRIVKGVDVVVVTAMDRVGRAVMQSGDRLKMVAIRSAGHEGTDLQAATDLGILVTRNPGANRQAVADLTIGLMLDVSRRITWMDRGMRQGRFRDIRINGRDIYRKRLGIIGLGNIGKAVAGRARGFEMTVMYHDIIAYPEFAGPRNIAKVSLDHLLREADIVSLHVPIDDTTRNMISAPQIATMKDQAILINTCRGGVVDEGAVYNGLCSGKLYGYGTDVHSQEPPRFLDLLRHERVVSTPHMAGLSEDGLSAMAMNTVEKIVHFLVGGEIPESVLNPGVLTRLRR